MNDLQKAKSMFMLLFQFDINRMNGKNGDSPDTIDCLPEYFPVDVSTIP